MRVIIAGGGIGGLTLALSLHQVGIEAIVCESVRTPEPLGVGILLQPAAMREMSALGLAADLQRMGTGIQATRMFTADGLEVLDTAEGVMAGYRWPKIGLHRGRLQMLLLEQARLRLGPEKVRTGMRLTSWRTTPEGVEAAFLHRASGGTETLEGDVLVGADGVNSACRAQLFPNEGPPRWTGRMLYRGVAAAPCFGDGHVGAVIGDRDRRLRLFPIGAPSDGMAPMNWVLELDAPAGDAPPRFGWNSRAEVAELEPHIDRFRVPGLHLRLMLRGAERVYAYPKIDRDPLPCWSLGGATLLGDAAHPSSPVGANAATQAIIDARVLTAALKRRGVREGLLAYEAARRADANRVLLANRLEGPERVLDVVALRLPGESGDLTGVLRPEELATMVASYRKVAGLDVEAVNGELPIITDADTATKQARPA